MLSPPGGMAKSVGHDDLDALEAAIGNAGQLDRLVHAFERGPGAGVARHRPAVERVVDDLLHAGRVKDRASSRRRNGIPTDARWWRIPRCGRRPSAPARRRSSQCRRRLAWRNTSPERSTPGPLPYHMPNTPSNLPSPRNSACCDAPQRGGGEVLIKAGLELDVGAGARCRAARMNCWSRPPSGEPR